MAVLEIVNGPLAGNCFLLSDHRETVVGRDGTCDIVLARGNISRRHARVVVRSGKFFLEDLGSVNGTFLNREKTERLTELHDGDRINVHDVFFVFHEAGFVPFQGLSPFAQPTFLPHNSPSLPSGSETVTLGGDTSPEFKTFQPEVQLRSIARINAQLCTSMDVDEVLPQVLDLLFEAFPQAINGHILLLDQDGQLTPRALKQGRDDDSSVFTRVPVHDSVARHVMQTGEIAVFESKESAWVVGDDEPSTMTVPILGPSQERLGVIHLELHTSDHPLNPTDIELVAAVGHATGQAVELARAHRRLLEVDRRQQQLIFARDVQLRMLPQTRPNVEGYSIASYYSPADEVGGDFYSFFGLSNGGVVIALGDVCGKGVPAALLMAELIAEVRHAVTSAETVKHAMRQINRVAYERELRLVTLTLCVLDPQRHALSVANAGHLPPLLRRHATGFVERLQPKRSGLPLAVVKDQEFHPETFRLDPGDTVLLFTDGVSETMNQSGTLYGMSRTQATFQNAVGGPDRVLPILMDDVKTFRGNLEPTDDVCLLCFQRQLSQG